jgi:hypothetical protein
VSQNQARSNEWSRLIQWLPLSGEIMDPTDRWLLRLSDAKAEHGANARRNDADLKRVVLAAYDAKVTIAGIQRASGLSGTTIRRWIAQAPGVEFHGRVAPEQAVTPIPDELVVDS